MFRAFSSVLVSSRRSAWKKHLGDVEKVLIPLKPCPKTIDRSKVEPAPELDSKMIRKLEKVSLIRFESQEDLDLLRNSIEHANQIAFVDVSNVEPMYFVHEDEECLLREDISELTNKDVILGNSKFVEDDHFVTPPGNVPLDDNELLGSRRQKK